MVHAARLCSAGRAVSACPRWIASRQRAPVCGPYDAEPAGVSVIQKGARQRVTGLRSTRWAAPIGFGFVTIIVASSTSWPDIMTAFGTVGAVVAAVGIALWAERRSDGRLTAERKRSDRLLADERAHSRAEIEEERRIGQEREQLAEAYAVQIAPVQTSSTRSASPPPAPGWSWSAWMSCTTSTWPPAQEPRCRTS